MQFKPLLDSYFQASNDHDVAAMLGHFAEDVIVLDEGKEHHGREQVRHWLEETNAAYHPSYVVQELSADGEKAKAVVTASGTFPGSPIRLTFNFGIVNGKIKSLTFGG